MERTTKKLLEIVLENLDNNFKSGLCKLVCELSDLGVISPDEKKILLNYINQNAPSRLGSVYNWPKRQIEPRRKWLQKEIEKLHKKEVEETYNNYYRDLMFNTLWNNVVIPKCNEVKSNVLEMHTDETGLNFSINAEVFLWINKNGLIEATGEKKKLEAWHKSEMKSECVQIYFESNSFVLLEGILYVNGEKLYNFKTMRPYKNVECDFIKKYANGTPITY